ncbi:hypothetical protein ACQQ4G_003125 [Listeria monocytogenes]
MANEENLQPVRTEEEARELGRKGGIASGIARRRKRNMKDAIDLLLSNPCNLSSKDGKTIKQLAQQLGIPEEDIDNQMAMIISMFKVSLSGGKNSVSAATFLRDTVGEKPIDVVEMNGSVDKVAKEVDEYVESRSK